jgi:hypothetical protein
MTAKIDHCGRGLRCANNMEMETGDLEYGAIPHGATEGAASIVVVPMRRSCTPVTVQSSTSKSV